MMRKNTIFSPKRNRIACFYRSIIKQWRRKILRLPNKDVPVISAKNACFFVAFLACETQDFASLLGYRNNIAVVMGKFYRSIIKQ